MTLPIHTAVTQVRVPAVRARHRVTSRLAWLVGALAVTCVACSHDGGGSPAHAPAAPSARAAGAASEGEPTAPALLEGLPPTTHPITTNDARAQRYFDQGLMLMYGFNHEAAIRSFEEALRLDPACAMCRWGVAIALGPNINRPMGPEAAVQAYAQAQLALAAAGSASTRERAYIDALALRYADPPPDRRAGLDLAFAEAMREVYLADPSDVDAATLFAESLMDLYPWNYWTSAGEPRAYTEELLTVLEGVLEQAPDHVGANHLYIHAVEEFFPEKGVAAADRLNGQAPDAGHLVHMPSHIYWRVGRYEDAADINQRASAADERYFAWCGPDAFYRAAYYPHNVHFLWATAMAEGRAELALTTSRKLEASTREMLVEMPFTQEFVATPMLTLARFGQWDAVLGQPVPAEEHVYLAGISAYTRGLAQVRTGRLDAAEASWAALSAQIERPEAETLLLAGGTSSARALLGIGRAHLEGELAAARSQDARALEALERAVTLHDALPYMEPPPWYASPRLALGAQLLDMNRAAEAADVYRADLEAYPKNGWALFGLAQSLDESGRPAEADWAMAGFEHAWARADAPLDRSSL
jgi:tetratricopeptide (TPR) repeat protein